MTLSDIKGRGGRLDVPASGNARRVRQEWVNGWRSTLIEAKGRG
jgi:ribosome modulation factor